MLRGDYILPLMATIMLMWPSVKMSLTALVLCHVGNEKDQMVAK